MVAGPYNPDAFNPAQRPDENMPERSTLGWARDVAIDTVRGVGKMVGAIPAIASDVLPADEEGRPAAQRQQEGARAFDELLRDRKTAKGQFKERTGRDDAGFVQRAGEAIITSAPALIAGALTGGAGSAALFAAQGYGDFRNESEAKIYGATEDTLRKEDPKYVEMRDRGMSDAQARHQLYSDSLDVGGAIATTIGAAAGGYGPGRVLGKALTRSATEMTDRLIKRVPLSAAEGAAGMGMMAGTGEFARQRADIASGFRDTMDPDAILKQTLESGEIGGAMGAVAGIPRRGPRLPEVKRTPEQKPAEPLNADTLATAAEQLGRPGEPQPSDWAGLQKHVDEQTQEPNPFGPSGPLAPADEPGAPPPPPPGAGPPPAPSAPRARRAAAPTPPSPAGPSTFPREELFRRAVDPTLTPDHGTLLKHIAEWQAANPGEKLGADRNVLQKQAKAAREEARKAAEVTPASKPVEEVAPIEQAKPVEPVVGETKPVELAEPAAPVVEAAAAPVVEELPAVAPKGPLSGEAAAPAIAKAAEERVARVGAAADIQAGEPTREVARGSRAEARARQREDEATRRETAAKETREEHTPGANLQAENTAMTGALKGAGDVEVPGLVKPLIERAKAILKDYGARMYDMAGKTRKHEVFGAFDPGGRANVGPKAGPFHAYMGKLHNFVRDTNEALRNHQFGKARDLGLKHLDIETKMLTEGGAEKMIQERREKSEKITAAKREVVHDERVEVESTTEHEQAVKAEAEQEARIDKGPKATVKPGERRPIGKDKHGRLIFKASMRDTIEAHPEDYASPGYGDREKFAGHMDALEDAAAASGKPLELADALKILEGRGENIEHTTVRELLGDKVRMSSPIMDMIRKKVVSMVGDTEIHLMSHEAKSALDEHQTGDISLAAYDAPQRAITMRPASMAAETLLHEALHAATIRALQASPRLNALFGQLARIVKDTEPMRDYKDYDPPAHEHAFSSTAEFLAAVFTDHHFMNAMHEVTLTPEQSRLLRDGGLRERNALRRFIRTVLNAIGFKSKDQNLLEAATDLLHDTFRKEREIAGTPESTYWHETDEAHAALRALQAKDPALAGLPVDVNSHGVVTNWIVDHADRLAESNHPETFDKVQKYLMAINNSVYDRPNWEPGVTPMSNSQSVFDGVLKFLNDRGGNLGKDIAFRAGRPASALRSVAGYGFTWTRKLKEMGEQPFRDVMSPAIDFLAKHGAFAQRYMTNGGQHSSEPAQKLLADLADLKHSIKDRGLWDKFEQFMVRESAHGAYADEALHVGRNAHIDKNLLVDEQTRQEHADVQQAWKEIADRSPELKEMRRRLHEYGAAEQEARSRALISDMAAMLEMVPASDKVGREAIVKRVRNEQDSWTPAEKARIDELANHPDYEENIRDIKKTRELVKLAGPYVPFMRRGQHSLMSKYKVEPDKGVDYKPTNAEPKDGVHEGFDFANLADAKKFITDKLNANGLSQREGHEVVLDKTTGKAARVYTDAEFEKAQAEGKAEWEKEHGPNVPYPPKVNRVITAKEFKEEPDKYGHAELRHRVTFNPRDYQLFESEREAHEEKARREASDKSGLTITTEVERAPDHMSRANSPQTSNEMQRLIDRLEGKKSYQNLTPSEQAKVKRDLLLESMRIQTTSARRSRFLPRTYARGASTDILQNYMEMAHSQSHSMADLTYRADIADAIAKVDEYNQGHQYAEGAAERQMAASELKHRAYAPPLPNTVADTAISRALRISGVAHLADLGYLAMNATDNWINALPVVGGRHGYWASAKELLRSSRLFEPSAMAKAAFGDIVQAAQRKPQTVNYEKLAGQMIDAGVPDLEEAGRLKQNLHNIFEKGLISPDAGMEVERLRNLDANIAGRQFERVDGVFRAASTGVETHNRLSLATQAYRLEYELTKDHAKAMQYAEDTVFKGAGDYAAWNRPSAVNQRWLRLGMQFKQFPMRIMANYADAIMGTARGEPEKMKQLAFMLATQSVAAGALGLPLGPMSGAVNAAYMLGLTDKNWDDQVAGMRKWVANNSTPAVAEVLFHGLPRVLGIDTSRLGQNSFIFFGSPDTQKPVDNLKSGMWMLAGAPGDMVRKWDDGIHQAIEAWGLYQNGAHEQARTIGIQAATNLIQVKMFTDVGRSVLQASGGPATKTRGGLPLGNEYTTYHAILRAIGITPAAEAEASEKRSIIKRDQTRQQQGHTAAMQMFINANDKELSSIFRGIQENYNPGKPADQQINYGQLLRARFQAQQAAARDVSGVGVRVSNKNRSIAQERSYYNTGP